MLLSSSLSRLVFAVEVKPTLLLKKAKDCFSVMLIVNRGLSLYLFLLLSYSCSELNIANLSKVHWICWANFLLFIPSPTPLAGLAYPSASKKPSINSSELSFLLPFSIKIWSLFKSSFISLNKRKSSAFPMLTNHIFLNMKKPQNHFLMNLAQYLSTEQPYQMPG